MSIANELSRIKNAQVDIKNLVKRKGVRIPKNDKIDTYGSYIEQISDEPITQTRAIVYPIEGTSYKKYELYKFTHIPLNFLNSNNEVQEVHINGTVVQWYNYAISNCENLETVNITNGSTYLRIYTLSDCPKLDNIHLPSTLTTVASSVFKNSTGLKNVTVASGYKADLPLGSAENLTLESLQNIITNYKSASGKKLTLHPTAYALAESNGLIETATAKGLTIAQA